MPVSVVLRPISPAAAAAVAAGRRPDDVTVATDYPTEFSTGVVAGVGRGQALGPYFVHRGDDDVVVGEIGGDTVEPATVEIGYAIVASEWRRGHASAAVSELVAIAADDPAIERLVAHTPLDRPASGRVLEKAGFERVAEVEDEHDGQVLRVLRWARDVSGRAG